MANTHLNTLLRLARNIPASAIDREEQRRSFAYGNTHIENDRITREMIDEAADRISLGNIAEPSELAER